MKMSVQLKGLFILCNPNLFCFDLVDWWSRLWKPSNLATGNKYTMIIQVQDVAAPYYKSEYHFDLFHKASSLNCSD